MRTSLALASGALGLTSAAFGQSVAPPSREQVTLPKPDAAPPAPSTVHVDGKTGVPSAACPLSDSQVRVTIGSVKFSGTGGAPLPAEIAPLLAGPVAAAPQGESSIAIVCDIRDRATAALRAAGYIASVQIPPQRIEDGVLKLEVVTAHIVEVHVRGEAGPYRKTLAARIEKLKALNPLNERDAERVLLLADDVPGLNVQLALRPAGTAPGEVIGDLTITTQRASLLLNVQDYGSRQIGRVTGYARAEVYGLTRRSDLTSIAGQVTSDFKEQKVLQAVHQMGLGYNGVTLTVSGTYADSRPSIGVLDIRSRSLLASAAVEAPLIRSITDNVHVGAGFDLSEQRTKVAGTPLNRDKLRAAFVRIVANHRELLPDGSDAYSIGGRVEVRQGLDIFGATKVNSTSPAGYRPSRAEGKATATVVQGDVDAMFALDSWVSFAGSVRAQWASAPLLNFDEFSIGNLSIGKGYDPGANSGDRAVGTHGEVRINVIKRPKARVQLFGFYDSVWLWNLDANTTEKYRNLRSYGGGFRFALNGWAMLEATYARPQDQALLLPGTRRATDRFLVSLTTRFTSGGR